MIKNDNIYFPQMKRFQLIVLSLLKKKFYLLFIDVRYRYMQ